MLAARIVRDLGVAVTGLHCMFRFDPVHDDTRADIDRLYSPVNIPVEVRDITEAFLNVVLYPEHGYGSGINPCIDCKIFMFRQAKLMMQETGARFIVTGEVLGQRPMTQNRPMMMHIEKSAGLKGLVLRPLTALRLSPSVPEDQGWVDRNLLYGIAGRGRKDQIRMAEQFGFSEYNQPAGGCLLTDPQFSRRARALFQVRTKASVNTDDLRLLRLGRHFWIENRLHVIVGRHEQDNALLKKYSAGRPVLEPADIPGPLALAEGIRDRADLETAGSIVARYCKHGDRPVRMKWSQEQQSVLIDVHACAGAQCRQWQV
ncbi:tRNA 4-thiouridine(8) synthase ThiI [bacterium]|nr:tRNA 4-thiouridine(8) synthase ThiI [bacterium]